MWGAGKTDRGPSELSVSLSFSKGSVATGPFQDDWRAFHGPGFASSFYTTRTRIPAGAGGDREGRVPARLARLGTRVPILLLRYFNRIIVRVNVCPAASMRTRYVPLGTSPASHVT